MLFANEEEMTLLFDAATFDDAVAAVEETGLLAASTRGAAGSVVVAASGPVPVAADAVERVVDTTGAGDLYAAGFLYGLTHAIRPRGLCPAGRPVRRRRSSPTSGPAPRPTCVVWCKAAGLL